MEQEKKQHALAITVWAGNKQHQLNAACGDNLLMVLTRAKLPVEFFCTTGKCRTCILRLQAPVGSASPASATEQYRVGREALAKGFRLACQVFISGPMTVFLDTPGSA
ncbi:hypothetical protein BRE01_31700 [Brevibacillus reuszeri]|uniref:Ferredoxin n=1 Tax=Brevibacillus reuszeri TaxID=54915 RepID=A0A0K9YYI1_9BACL|nr:2Fe-2S iron-sulfur cluster-binding protein [Brevibacillus reuszeri]KNB73697.1 ferredoxin [Brevibacillus reuszeri]MED1858493.1 2Fe-2S iron-sulfur cluster-binding protein [Brevibacillus reuszeri]GED69468.1 hypothetical protein BRE01_31700 [Brevibacillus reuszeri]